MNRVITSMLVAALFCGCSGNKKEYKMGTYGYDLAFIKKQNIEAIAMTDSQR